MNPPRKFWTSPGPCSVLVNIVTRPRVFVFRLLRTGNQAAQLARYLLFLGLLISSRNAFSQTNTVVLTNAVDVITLPEDQAASSLKVLITGVVTAADPVLKGRFFLQDATSGVFVDNVNGRRPEPGEVVEVAGITYAGAFAPTVTAPTVRTVGQAALPPAKSVSIDQLMSGAEDSQRIEISGIVRNARKDDSRLTLDMVAGGYHFRAYLPGAQKFDPDKLIGARVRVRGTAAEAHNRSLRQFIAPEVYIPDDSDLVIEKSEAINPFERPIIPLNQLAQFRRDNSLAQRVHIRGAVTFQKIGESVFLQEGSFGLQIQSNERVGLPPGGIVDAVGFLSFEGYLPVLQDAVFRVSDAPAVSVTPLPATIDQLQSGLYHADYISLSGQLTQLTVNEQRNPAQQKTVMVLQTSNFTFTATADNVPDQTALAAIPIGSLINVSGIGLSQIDSDGKLQSFQILIGNTKDVTIIKKPSWLTPQRLWIGLLILCSALIVIASWLLVLSRKNAALNFLIGEREKAQQELQEAHDQLEVRVKERTEQLKFEITARKESEVQFKAVLTERTRLAQELHDTVEQTLTGIALQLDTASKLHERSPDNSLYHLELARSLMAKSQVEVRHSIWDLRSRALEQFDLSNALAEGARQITCGTQTEVMFVSEGEPRSLPEVVEENLLRIGQEALTNIIKHSSASMVEMKLQFEPQRVVLQIKDNGVGFDLKNCVGPNDGHFGLLGMSERARRLEGQFSITSELHHGTVVRVEIPLACAPELPNHPPVNGTVVV